MPRSVRLPREPIIRLFRQTAIDEIAEPAD